MAQKIRWHVNVSAVKSSVKKIPGFEAWFYTGPTRHFGHSDSKKKRKK